MTFEVFAHDIAVRVMRRLPDATFPQPGRNLRLGTATATVTFEQTHWLVRFEREGVAVRGQLVMFVL